MRKAAQRRFGRTGPAAIILTHGHFDHVCALEQLVRIWNVPVYAHERGRFQGMAGTSGHPPLQMPPGW
ncbi:MAG: MBL fold metallo-hydrolase [Verrucomicrobiia bacterium]